MSKIYSIIRNYLGFILIALSIYLLISIFKNPDKPALPLFRFTSQKFNNFLKQIARRPLLYPSQVKKITSYLEGLNTQLIEGFISVDTSSNSDRIYSYRGSVSSWWADNTRGGQEVIWNTAICPQKKITTFIFSGAFGPDPGKATIFLQGKPILTFDTWLGANKQIWNNKKYELRFFPIKRVHPSCLIKSGIFCLAIPENDITPGKPLKLKVRGKEGKGKKSYFILHNFSDTCQILSSAQTRCAK